MHNVCGCLWFCSIYYNEIKLKLVKAMVNASEIYEKIALKRELVKRKTDFLLENLTFIKSH